MYLRKSTFALAFLVSSYFVVLTAYDGYASTFSSTSGPIERTLGGVQGFFTNPSAYDSGLRRLGWQAHPLSPPSRKVKEVTRGERESSADALSRLSRCCLLCWPSCRPDNYRQSSLHMCMYAVHYAASVALAWLPISQQVFSKGMEVSPMWTSGKRVCAASQCCGQTASWESRSWTSSPHSHTLFRLHTNSFFEQAPVDRLLARRGSNQRRWNWQPMESDSLAQGRTQTPDTRPAVRLGKHTTRARAKGSGPRASWNSQGAEQ